MDKKFLFAVVAVLVVVGLWPDKPAGRIGVEVQSFGPFWYADYGNNCRISTHGWMPEPYPDTSGFGFSSIFWRWDFWDVCDSDTGAVWEKSHFELALGLFPESLRYGNLEVSIGSRPDLGGTRLSFAVENGGGESIFGWGATVPGG